MLVIGEWVCAGIGVRALVEHTADASTVVTTVPARRTGPPMLIFVSAMSDLTIRCATAQDIEPVLSLWDAAGGQPSITDTREGLLGLLASDGEALTLAEHDGSLVGSLIAAWDGWRGSFYRLAVHPDRRRQGIATQLLREGERRLRARGAARLTAIVAEDDPTAIGFWQAAGYTKQRDRVRFIRPTAD